MDIVAYTPPVHSEFLPIDFRNSRDVIHDHLKTITEQVTSSVNCQQLKALILGGGYARGEGGIRYEAEKVSPYNDYDLFAFFSSPAAVRDNREKINETAKELTASLGIDVDIYCTSLPCPQSAHTMMWIELYYGHIVLFGPNDFMERHFSHLKYDSPSKIDLWRLLVNRGAGLILAKLQMMSSKPDADFVTRNCHKATLALGDALLIINGLYSPYTIRRQSSLESLAELQSLTGLHSEVIQCYKSSVDFKLLPKVRETFPAGNELEEFLTTNFKLFAQGLDFFLKSEIREESKNFSVYQLCRSLYYQLLDKKHSPKTVVWGNIYTSLLVDLLELMTQDSSKESLKAFIEVWRKHS